jgi:hypothetical protein
VNRAAERLRRHARHATYAALAWPELVTLPSGGGFHSYRERDLVVEGDVPLDDRSGLLEIWFGQFGQAMVMHRDEASCQNMGRKQI